MFGTIRKHQTWLWAVIITLTVISFVVYFSPYSRMNSSGRRSGVYGSINGDKITDQQYRNASREVDLHSFFRSGGHWLAEDKKRSEQDIEREVYQWLLLTWEQDRLGIHLDEQATADYARQMVRSFERAGVTSPQMFIERVLQPHGLKVDDFERYARHYMGIQELVTTVGLSGQLITPLEARNLYERDHQEIASTAVFFAASNYLASVVVTPQAVSEFYSNRVANYGVPERVVVSYVRFNVTNFLPQAETELSTNLNDIVDSNFQRIGTNAATVFPEAKTPADVKAKIKEQVVRREALALASQKANEFAHKLFDAQPVQASNLDLLARTNGLATGLTAPFDRDQEPKGLDVGPEFTKAAFGLSADDPFGGPIAGQDGVYVIALQNRLPYQIPSLDQIRDRVESDYKLLQALARAQEAARNFYQTLTNGQAQGKTFTNLCAEAKVKPVELPAFSISTRSLPEFEELVSLDQLKQAAFSTQPGKASLPQRTSDGSMILYVKAKLPVEPARMQSDLPNYVNAVRRSRQQEAFDAWFRREAEKGLRDTPLGRPQPPQLGSAAKS
ncbi:MAG TPA: peptidylprolyl isomerase [Candidatus Acidoferrum sp.]|jgi:hypothetical protein|nr:peptidylprolyl isomerase [Candidatus Acidoferrum sp.]